MADFEKLNDQELDETAGGFGQNLSANIKHVANLRSGYLAVRTEPAAKYENEIQGTRLYNGDTVEITGNVVQGSTFNGGRANYVWVFVPKSGVSGYVNINFLK